MEPTKAAHRSRRGRSLVFAVLTVGAGVVVGAVIGTAILGIDRVFEGATMGAFAGLVLGIAGTLGALVGGWLAAVGTPRVSFRLVAVLAGAGIVVAAVVAGLGVDSGVVALLALVIGASLAVSSVAPWKGGFARDARAEPEPSPGPRVSSPRT